MYSHLFKPGRIAGMELKNRIVMAPMGNLADPDGGFSQRQIDYYGERAKGGVGLIISGALHFTSLLGSPYSGVFDNIKHVGRARELADRVHRYGGKLAFQFNMGGGRCGGNISASENPTVANPDVKTRAMTVDEIHAVVKAMGVSAGLAKAAGVDAILLHAYAGYLLDQFQSSQWNHRTDEYGGSLENRMRLTTELIGAIKKACGPSYPVIVKFSVIHNTPEGRQLEEGLQMCRMLEAAGADAIEVDGGSFETMWNRCIPTVYEPEAYNLELAKIVRETVSIPVLAQNKLNDPARANQALADGNCDFVALGHSLLADPDWAKKAAAGRPEEIRHCIGCNQCLLSVNTGIYFHCSVNPFLMHEQDPTYQYSTAPRGEKLLVIGGGPGGMAAAVMAARAGYGVELWEKTGALGGNACAAGAPLDKTDIREYVKYLIHQLELEKVPVKLNMEADAETVAAEMKPAAFSTAGSSVVDGFDAVILATGAGSRKLPIPGIDGANVMSALEYLHGAEIAADEIVVLGGGLVGCETACDIAAKGKKVTILEYLPKILMTGQEARNNSQALHKLVKASVAEVVTGAKVTEITSEGVRYETNGEEKFAACGKVVSAVGMSSASGLAAALEAKGIPVTVIGDAKAPRKIMNAVTEALFAVIDR